MYSVLITLALFTIINFLMDDFGLWGDKKSVRIWAKEKTSKHLLSYKYIPNNFDGILIGASVAANLNTKNIDGAKIYNLSMEGANTSELELCVNNVFEKGKIKVIIISLYPYITKDSGIKGSEIHPQEYWGSVFSTLPIRLLMSKIKSTITLAKNDKFKNSEWGYNDINIGVDVNTFYRDIEDYSGGINNNINVDKEAVKALERIIESARGKKIKIVAYFHPIFHKRFNDYVNSGTWSSYKNEMAALFTGKDILLDMNSQSYDYIRMNKENYTGMGHLSKKGADAVLEVIENHLRM